VLGQIVSMDDFEMPSPRRTLHDLTTSKAPVRKQERQATVVQLNRPLQSRTLKVSRKVKGKSRPRLSSGADPGPAGFDWIELFPER
jgi:hypothetical protein